jgi:hypothetical protein
MNALAAANPLMGMMMMMPGMFPMGKSNLLYLY